jgi:hypothetical protein
MDKLTGKEEWLESLTTREQIEALLIVFRATVDEVLGYFEGPGSDSKTRAGAWGAWETLCHFIRWHEATIEGIESVARSGEAYQVPAPSEEENAAIIEKHRGETPAQLISHLRALHERLEKAARNITDLDAEVIRFSGGISASARARLERMPMHWAEHVAVIECRKVENQFKSE